MGQVWMDRFSKYMKYGPPTFLSKNDETWSPPYLLSIWTNCTWDHIAKPPGATAVMTMCCHMLGQATEELFRYVATTSGIPYHKHCRSWIFQRRAGGWFHKSWSTCDVDGGWVDWILSYISPCILTVRYSLNNFMVQWKTVRLTLVPRSWSSD